MYRRFFERAIGAVLSAALVVTSPSYNVYAMEDGADVVLAGDENIDDVLDETEQESDSDLPKELSEEALTDEEASDTFEEDDAGDSEEAASNEDGEEDIEQETAAPESLNEESDTPDNDAVIEDTGEDEESYDVEISFPEDFEGFVDDEAEFEYAEEEVLLGSPSKGAVNLDISGNFYTLSAEKILNQINKIRKEACKEGVYYQGRKLTMDDYHPLEWSYALEQGTRIRAMEATMTMAHSTLGGGDIYDHARSYMTDGGWYGIGENLAWNNEHDGSGITYGINQFYEEKSTYLKTKTWSSNTGHYINLINPNYRYVGVGSCVMEGAIRLEHYCHAAYVGE